MLKHTDVAIRDAMIACADRDVAPGTQLVFVAHGAGGLSSTGGFLDAHRDQLDRRRERIVAGEIGGAVPPRQPVNQSTPERAPRAHDSSVDMSFLAGAKRTLTTCSPGVGGWVARRQHEVHRSEIRLPLPAGPDVVGLCGVPRPRREQATHD